MDQALEAYQNMYDDWSECNAIEAGELKECASGEINTLSKNENDLEEDLPF